LNKASDDRSRSLKGKLSMNRMRTAIKRFPLVSFFVLAYAFALGLALLANVSLLFGFLSLFGPAAAAILVTASVDGQAEVRALFRRLAIWRVGLRWYVVALGLPALLSLGVVGLSLALGAPTDVQFIEQSPLTVILFILVIGEELGWRGYALPRLQARYGGLGASLILGLLWAGWHLPNQFISGLEYYGYGFGAFTLYVLPMTVLFTWLANHTHGSVLLAWLFHGAINTLIFVNNAIDIVQRWWLSAAVYGVVAVVVVLVAGPGLRSRQHGQPVQAEPAATST
jgi:membrane protease YdiL (CAAX protease family)